jgi:pyrroline-5-carboxylate reductase
MSIITCIGSGNMAFALMKGVYGSIPGVKLFFTDIDSGKANSTAKLLNAGVLKSNIEAIEKGDFVFLAVKPQVMQQVLAEVSLKTKERISSGNPPVFVSMAAGWSIEKIQSHITSSTGVNLPVVRIMPNTPSLIGKGMIVLASSPEVKQERIDELVKMLSCAGSVDILDEKYLDAVTALSGSGPAFVYLFIEALADGGVQAGLPRDKALHYAVQTVLGAASMLRETGKHPGELKDMVASPGGTTIAGIAALEDGAFRGIVMNAIEAAHKRATELAG